MSTFTREFWMKKMGFNPNGDFPAFNNRIQAIQVIREMCEIDKLVPAFEVYNCVNPVVDMVLIPAKLGCTGYNARLIRQNAMTEIEWDHISTKVGELLIVKGVRFIPNAAGPGGK